jgi:hypothetical protein
MQAPPVQTFSDYYKKGTVKDEKNVELIQFSLIVQLTLDHCKVKDSNLEALKYTGDFLSAFCKETESYNNLSTEGKYIIDSFYSIQDNECIPKVIDFSGCEIDG